MCNVLEVWNNRKKQEYKNTPARVHGRVEVDEKMGTLFGRIYIGTYAALGPPNSP